MGKCLYKMCTGVMLYGDFLSTLCLTAAGKVNMVICAIYGRLVCTVSAR